MTSLDIAELTDRFRGVRERLERACMAAGRPSESVQLVAASKRQSAEAMRVLYGLGQREFGENYVQELVGKRNELSDLAELRLRMIGHLQRNKARYVVEPGTTVDTVDSLALGEALSKRAEARGLTMCVLVQVNIGEEPQKAGVLPADLPRLLADLVPLPHLVVNGLMAIPPDADGATERTRPYFRRLSQLAQQHGLMELSMGMSDDLEVAVDEGATMVRIGTDIFGARPG